MIEIARMFTFGCTNRCDIVRRLMNTNKFYQRLTFADALAQFRSSERAGLVTWTENYIVIYHNCED